MFKSEGDDVLAFILMILVFIVVCLAITSCIEDPEPSCPAQCEEIVLGGELIACQCDPDFFDEYCEEKKKRTYPGWTDHGPSEEECEEYW